MNFEPVVMGVAAFFIIGVFHPLGITCLWCIIELFHQKKRVEKGWFPKNPNRRD
ncbi:MAG: DUF4491 family protein [Spirochaetia bacterium]|nr:DUF4491 family protein [Spirochaetia bacterium]MBQ3712516.1 DUF4491 family protein [Spirochaetia bacterium]